ncbi:platelet glycoprotein IX [Spea bombifrons]|uniref:platelet glycoprotein IX n=1 Tax=Spea bombifrons TaxID=233779 RepID=UPI00234B733D|nr:platelet glycoprotein IX [Spea bombifrons]
MAKIWILRLLLVWLSIDRCHGDSCPQPCVCTTVGRRGFIIDCSFKKLRNVPQIPESAIRLYLQGNSLTTIPAGVFDHLRNLEEVDVSRNPWTCDCSVLYVKSWLEAQNTVRHFGDVRCATPAAVSQVPFQNLSGNELQRCEDTWPTQCREFFVRDLYLIGFAVVLLIFMSYALRISKRLACRVTMNIPTGNRFKTCTRDSHKST